MAGHDGRETGPSHRATRRGKPTFFEARKGGCATTIPAAAGADDRPALVVGPLLDPPRTAPAPAVDLRRKRASVKERLFRFQRKRTLAIGDWRVPLLFSRSRATKRSGLEGFFSFINDRTSTRKLSILTRVELATLCAAQASSLEINEIGVFPAGPTVKFLDPSQSCRSNTSHQHRPNTAPHRRGARNPARSPPPTTESQKSIIFAIAHGLWPPFLPPVGFSRTQPNGNIRQNRRGMRFIGPQVPPPAPRSGRQPFFISVPSGPTPVRAHVACFQDRVQTMTCHVDILRRGQGCRLTTPPSGRTRRGLARPNLAPPAGFAQRPPHDPTSHYAIPRRITASRPPKLRRNVAGPLREMRISRKSWGVMVGKAHPETQGKNACPGALVPGTRPAAVTAGCPHRSCPGVGTHTVKRESQSWLDKNKTLAAACA